MTVKKEFDPNKPKFSLGHFSKTTLNFIFIPALLLLIFISIFLYHQLNNLIIANNWVVHTEEVIQNTDAALFEIISIESSQRAYLITGEEDYLKEIENSKIQLYKNLDKLKSLTVDNLEQNQRIESFIHLIDLRIARLTQVAKLKKMDKFNTPEAFNQFKKSQDISTRVKGLGQEIKSVESTLLKERNVLAINRASITNVILIIGSSVSLAFLFLAFILASSQLSTRRTIEKKQKKSELQLRSIIESATDMIAAFDKEGRYILFNQPYQREFKRLFNKSIFLGMYLQEAIKDASIENQKIAIISANTYETTQELELTLDNEKIVYERIVSDIQNDNNEVEGSVHILRNISKRILQHEELKQSYQSLADGMVILKEKNRQITLLVEMSELMLVCSSPEEFSLAMSKYAYRMLNFTSGCLYMMHPSKNYLECIAKWGNTSPITETFSPDQCWSIRRGRIHQINCNHEELTCGHIVQPELTEITLCVPLMAQNDIYGILYLEINKVEQDNLKDHKLLINAFAELTALALANIRLRENLRYQSIRDPLTGLYNRRYLEDFLFKQIHQAERTKSCLSVLMLDLDHFKKLNDTFGHDAGDIALKECAKIFQNDIRVSDIASRYGGEEFILVLYGTDAHSAKVRAESILHAVTLLQIRYGAQIVGPLTVSIGIADYPHDAKSLKSLIEAADRALYFAKNNGRNQIALAGTIDDSTGTSKP